jgi:hypothetical protein
MGPTIRPVDAGPSREELEAAHCWEDGDRLPGRPETTAFRRAARLQQARWRAAQGHPIGSQPIAAAAGEGRPVGSRLPLEHALATGANFVSAGALAAVQARLATAEPHQSVDRQRLFADLLWSPALAVNLFADLDDDGVRRLWPDAPGRLSEIRFAHSPGWLDPAYLGNLSSFAAVMVLDLGGGERGVIGVAVRYHDWLKPEIPKPRNLDRYLAVADRSGAFAPGATERFRGRDALTTTWLPHLLLLSILQHPTERWTWGRFVVVHPAGNLDVADGMAGYGDLLADRSTFSVVTLEALLGAGALPAATAAALEDRYLVPPS